MNPSFTTACGLYPMPVRKSSCPVLEVSMWPLNIRFLPPPEPFQRPTTLARSSSTSCQVTSRPSFWSDDCMYCAIASSPPVGLGILITSVDMAMISSSQTSARTRSIILGSRDDFELVDAFDTITFPTFSPQLSVTLHQTEIVRVATKFFVAVFGDQKIIFQSQSSAALPINAGLNCQHHSLFYGAGASLVSVGPFVCPRSNSVADRMGGLSRISTFGNARANQFVE